MQIESQSVEGAEPGAVIDGAGTGSPGDSPVDAAPGEASIVPPSPTPMEAAPSIAPDDEPKRKRGRPSNAELEARRARMNGVTPPPPRVPPPIASTVPAPVPIDYDAMAQVAANLWFNFPCMVLGDEWAPDKDEIAPIHRAFKDYFESEKVAKIPPAWGLGLVLATYAAKRTQRPTIRERFYAGVAWVRAKLGR